MASILKIIVDLPCQVYCDYEYKGETMLNSIFRLDLRKGTYIIEFKIGANIIHSLEYVMQSNEEEDLIRVSLFIHVDNSLFENNIYKCIKFREYNIKLLHHNNHEYFIAEKDGKHGVIDKYGRNIIPLLYKKIKFGYGVECMIAIGHNDKYGIINYENKIILPFVYDEIGYTKDKYDFFVRIGNNWGVCNKVGEIKISPIYEKVVKYSERIWDESDYDYISYYIVKKNGKYGVVDTDFSSGETDFKEIIPCKYDYIYTLYGVELCENEFIDRINDTLYYTESPFGDFVFVREVEGNLLPPLSLVDSKTIKACAVYDKTGNITREFSCNSFNQYYKILNGKYFLWNDLENVGYDNITEIISYDGTWRWKNIVECDGHYRINTGCVEEWNKTYYYDAQIGSKHNIIKLESGNLKHLVSIYCDKVIEFGRGSCTENYFAIVKIDNYCNLIIYDNNNPIPTYYYQKEIHSVYQEIVNRNIHKESLSYNTINVEYFICRDLEDKWSIFNFNDPTSYLISSTSYDLIWVIDEELIEVRKYENNRTLFGVCAPYNTDTMPKQWYLRQYYERKSNWVEVFDVVSQKEGIIIESYTKNKETELCPFTNTPLLEHHPKQIIVPFEYEFIRVCVGSKSQILVYGVPNTFEDRKISSYGILKCNRKHLTNNIFNHVYLGNSRDLHFSIGDIYTCVDLNCDNIEYQAPFFEYQSINEGGEYIKANPFTNIKLFIDIETTGLPIDENAPYNDLKNWPYLVQIAFILEDENLGTLAKRNIIVKPEGYTIPAEAAKIHGISQEFASKNGENRVDVIGYLDLILSNTDVVIGHNVDFDINVVKAEILRIKGSNHLFEKKDCSTIDTMKLGKDICKLSSNNRNGDYKYPKLKELYFCIFNKYFNGQHNAINDIQATYECYIEMKRRGLI